MAIFAITPPLFSLCHYACVITRFRFSFSPLMLIATAISISFVAISPFRHAFDSFR
jgi:hypothetical protein